MQKPNDLNQSRIVLKQDSTLIAVIEMSLSSWLVAGIVPGVERQPLKKLAVDESALLKLLNRWREEAEKAGRRIERITRTSAPGVSRDKAALSSGCKPHPANAPAGSSRSSYGGDEIAEAFGMRVTNWSSASVQAVSRPALSCSINSALTPICTSSFTPHGAWRSGRVPKAASRRRPPRLRRDARCQTAAAPPGDDGPLPQIATVDARRRAASRHRRSVRHCALSAGTRAVWSRAQAA